MLTRVIAAAVAILAAIAMIRSGHLLAVLSGLRLSGRRSGVGGTPALRLRGGGQPLLQVATPPLGQAQPPPQLRAADARRGREDRQCPRLGVQIAARGARFRRNFRSGAGRAQIGSGIRLPGGSTTLVPIGSGARVPTRLPGGGAAPFRLQFRPGDRQFLPCRSEIRFRIGGAGGFRDGQADAQLGGPGSQGSGKLAGRVGHLPRPVRQ